MKIVISKDKYGTPIQALALDAVVSAPISGTSARVALPADIELARVVAPVNCYIAFGDDTVTASSTDHAMLTGVEIFRVKEGDTHIACVQLGAVTGNLQISKMV